MSDQERRHIEQMRALAEIGASLCTYLPGAGNADEWPLARCDCKFLPTGHNLRIAMNGYMSGEQTGCCELRVAWLALDTLRERTYESETHSGDVDEKDAALADILKRAVH
jgi:hypothetical protein